MATSTASTVPPESAANQTPYLQPVMEYPGLPTPTTPVPFPPHPADLVERLAEVRVQYKRDNGLWCLQELRDILDSYPWSKEAADLYGLMASKVHHTQSRLALFNLSEWIAIQDMTKSGGWVHRVDDGLTRFRLMTETIRGFLTQNAPGGDQNTQWADIADLGAQHGEMLIHWIGIPGARHGFACELAITNCHLGKKWYHDPRLHHLVS